MAGIIEGADQPGEIAQGRVLLPPLGECAQRLALEVENVEIIVDDDGLPQMEVALVTGSEAEAGRGGGWCGEIEDGVPLAEQPLRLGARRRRGVGGGGAEVLIGLLCDFGDLPAPAGKILARRPARG